MLFRVVADQKLDLKAPVTIISGVSTKFQNVLSLCKKKIIITNEDINSNA